MLPKHPTRIVFRTANILSLIVKLVLSQSVNNIDTCKTVVFYRRPEMDDVVFTGSLIEEVKQVDMRADCFSQCHRQKLCNLVLYNQVTSNCRLYSHALGSSNEAGWQYYGISCDNFRLDNANADVDVINTVPQDVCNSNFIASDDRTSSCYKGASWEVVPVKCVSCYIGLPRQYTYPNWDHEETLTFDLAAGMKLKMEVSGATTKHNSVWIANLTEDLVYVLSLRWSYNPTVAIFNTRQGGVFGAEERVYGLSVTTISNYSIEIHFGQSAFETYVDGILWMTNQMRLPFVGIRRVGADGFTALHSFRVGYETC
ncbi:uncharacterized protein [Haliotis asinina]|uniref:uncharacterized protein n=1 Tax=Haliotis asinina TaxID=109174 RepID=UPI003531D3B0